MIQSKAWYKRNLSVGPGGMNCSCCAPAPGPFRKQVLKTIRHRNNRTLDREEAQEYLNEILLQSKNVKD